MKTTNNCNPQKKNNKWLIYFCSPKITTSSPAPTIAKCQKSFS